MKGVVLMLFLGACVAAGLNPNHATGGGHRSHHNHHFDDRDDDDDYLDLDEFKNELGLFSIYDPGRALDQGGALDQGRALVRPTPPPPPAHKNESRTLIWGPLKLAIEKQFWLIIQQALVIGLLILASIYAIYVLVIPLVIGEAVNRSLDFSLETIMDNKITEVLGTVMRSIDPVDMTFGVMDIGEESCRQRAFCQLRQTAAFVSPAEHVFKSYLEKVPGVERYREAIKSGASLKNCAALYSACKIDPVDSLSRFLRLK